MNIVILGAGKTGSHGASVLSAEGCNVTVVDPDAAALLALSAESDVSTLHAPYLDSKTLEELSQKHPDLLFAATESDETNLIACALAKHLGFTKTAALIRSSEGLNHERLDFNRLFFVDHLLAADLLAAQDLFKVLLHEGDLALEHFAHGAIQMRTLTIPETWSQGGIPLKDLRFPEEFIVGLIHRKSAEGEQILFPHGTDTLLPGDEATVLGDAKVINHLHQLFSIPEKPIKSVFIAGASFAAFHLAKFLSAQKIDVRVIEQNLLRCQQVAALLPQTTVIHRDAHDLRFLKAEGIESVDAFVSCFASDANNLYCAALAKEAGCKKTVALLTRPDSIPLVEQLGVIPALSPEVFVANRLLSILHEQQLLSVASVCNNRAKIAELKIPPSSKAVGIPLSDLSQNLPQDLLIAVIENRGRVMIGRGNRILCPNDTVIAIFAPHHLQQLPDLFCR